MVFVEHHFVCGTVVSVADPCSVPVTATVLESPVLHVIVLDTGDFLLTLYALKLAVFP